MTRKEFLKKWALGPDLLDMQKDLDALIRTEIALAHLPKSPEPQCDCPDDFLVGEYGRK